MLRKALNKATQNKKGFTLAELLIVVAIIGVLVAISIPIFTTQLEKAREATDEANIRSIYAQLSADVLTETESASNTACPVAASYSVKKGTDGVITGTATYTMTQKTDGLASGSSVTIGGVEIKSASFTTGTCTITIKDDGTATSITFAKPTTTSNN
jgi:prepilin-type N-terminal cleavage/methylation domain-containing protein